MVHIPWNELPPDKLQEKRRGHRNRRKLRELGRPSLVDAAPTMAYVRRLHDDGGMTFREIAEAATALDGTGHMAQSTPSDLYRGHRSNGKVLEKIPRRTQDRIMAVQPPVYPAVDSQALVPAVGSRRRLQALVAAGWGFRTLSDMLGHGDHNWVWRLATGYSCPSSRHKHERITSSAREVVEVLYEKLAGQDPAENGITAQAIGRAKKAAERRSWAPVTCWDDDTIDKPDTFPEWTGECGTVGGYYLHLKYDLLVHNYGGVSDGHQSRKVLCQPCVTARGADEAPVQYSKFDWSLIGDLLKKGLTHREIADQVGCSKQTAQRVANKMKAEGWKPPRDRRKAI